MVRSSEGIIRGDRDGIQEFRRIIRGDGGMGRSSEGIIRGDRDGIQKG